MEVALIGDGGHSKVIRDLLLELPQYKLVAVFDDKYERPAQIGTVYKGPLKAAPMLMARYPHLKFVAAIGSNSARKLVVYRLGLPAERYLTLVHPSAVVSRSASLGPGTVVMAHATVQAEVHIGRHAVINTGAIIEHDNRLDDYVHTAPRATLTGSVHVMEGAMIGAGAIVIPGKTIGEWSVIGAGATVIQSIPPNSTAVGIPAKIISFGKEVRAANGTGL